MYVWFHIVVALGVTFEEAVNNWNEIVAGTYLKDGRPVDLYAAGGTHSIFSRRELKKCFSASDCQGPAGVPRDARRAFWRWGCDYGLSG